MFTAIFRKILKTLETYSRPQKHCRVHSSRIFSLNVYSIKRNIHAEQNGSMGFSHQIKSFCSDGILEETVFPESSMFSRLLRDCRSTKSLEGGKRVQTHMIKTGFYHQMFAQNSLVNMYAKCGSLENAREVFDKMPTRNATSWASVISAYVHNGHCKEALKLFFRLQLSGIKPNEFVASSILKACSSIGDLKMGSQLYAYILKIGLESNTFVGNTLISLYAKCGSIVNARIVFENMVNRNVASWNTMIAGYSRGGLDEEALKLCVLMQREYGLNWDHATFATVVAVCANMAAISLGTKLHGHLLKTQFDSNVFVGTALIDMYAKCGRADDAWRMFNQMPIRNVVSWTAMLVGYAQHGNLEKTLKLFAEMLLEGMKSDEYTYATVLSACGTLAALEHGKQIHAHIVKTGFYLHILVGNALLDMYSKSGSIIDGCKFFNEMTLRDVVSWNSMISGYAHHGYGKEVIELFEQMKQENVSPDHITFIAVLSACNHEALLSEGWYYFNCMSDHGIAPHMEHYTCMIGLLAQTGQLDKAEEMINSMPYEPDFVAWRALLGACRDHGKIELGERVANYILKIEPQDPGTYMLLSHLYADAGRWDCVANVRKLMKDRGIKKEPGLSWIEIRNRVHVFSVGDKRHPQTEEIYAKLQEITEQMKKEGYSPDLSSLNIEQD